MTVDDIKKYRKRDNYSVFALRCRTNLSLAFDKKTPDQAGDGGNDPGAFGCQRGNTG